MTKQDILNELRGYLLCAREWSDPANLAPDGQWSCVWSTLQAVEQGNVGLALERWDDLMGCKPKLSPEAEGWRP